MNYTEAQKEEILSRVKKALAILKGMELTPAATVQKVNIGNDEFVDKVVPYLQDFRYTNESAKTPEKPLEA